MFFYDIRDKIINVTNFTEDPKTLVLGEILVLALVFIPVFIKIKGLPLGEVGILFFRGGGDMLFS